MNKILSAILLTFVITTGLIGCIPVAIVAGAAAGGVIVSDQRELKTIWKDNDISYKAQVDLNNDKQLRDQSNITVVVFNNAVLLVGETMTAELKNQASQIVSKVAGVKRVYNQISVEPPIGALIKSNDAWITTKVKANMLAEKGLKSAQIKVVTENSVVYLLGTTTRKQADLAAEVARRVEGVRKVVKMFEYN